MYSLIKAQYLEHIFFRDIDFGRMTAKKKHKEFEKIVTVEVCLLQR